MNFEYKNACIKSGMMAFYDGFNKEIQSNLDAYSSEGWKLVDSKLQSIGAGPGMLCLLIFEREQR